MTAGWPDATSRDLQVRLLDWIHRSPAGFDCQARQPDQSYGLTVSEAARLDQEFDAFALELFAYQFERVPLYRRWCQQLGRLPTSVQAPHEIPALPVEAFRGQAVHSFPRQEAVARFRTSGTTSARTGTLVLDDLTLYETSLLRSFEHHVLPDRHRIRMLQVIPTAAAAPHSSLAHMIDCIRARWGTKQSDCYVDADGLQVERLQKALMRCTAADEPVLLLGTAFAWVAFLDTCGDAGWNLRLPRGSRLFETGGYKGRARTLTRSQLLQCIEHCLGIPASHVVSEYGMTELGSQYYTISLRATLRQQLVPTEPTWSFPFWLRPRLLHPEETLPRSLQNSQSLGLLLHHDLANLGSVSHVMTADLGIPRGASFVLAGRAPVADLRGCGVSQESLDTSRGS